MAMPLENRKDITVSLPGDWVDLIEEGELGYRDSMSAWVREAVRQRLEREGIIDANGGDPFGDDGATSNSA